MYHFIAFMQIRRGGGLEKADAHRRCGKDRWTVGGAKAGESDVNGRGDMRLKDKNFWPEYHVGNLYLVLLFSSMK